MPDTLFVIASFISILTIIIFGSIVFKIDWRKHLLPLCLIAIYTTFIVVTLKGNIHPLLYLFILVGVLSILIRFVTKIHIFITSLAVLIGAIVAMLAEVIALSMLGMSGNEAMFPNYLYGNVLQWTILIGLIILFEYFDLNFQIKAQYYRPENKRIAYHVKWIAVLFLIFVSSFVIFYQYSFTLKSEDGILLALSLIISIALGIYLVRNRYLGELELVEDTINKQYDIDVNRYIDVIRMQKHDIVDYLLRVRMMLEVGQIQDSKDYIDKVIDDTSRASGLVETYSEAITGILFVYEEEAQQKGIQIEYEVQDDLKNLPCQLYETSYILSSILNHAIEETMNLPEEERQIDLFVEKKQEDISIQVINPYSAKYKSRERGPSDAQLVDDFSLVHLAGVQSIIEKYNGKVISNYIDNSHSIKIEIPY